MVEPTPSTASAPERVILLFPGQGLHYVGMGRELSAAFPSALALFEEADEALGFSLSRLAWEGPLETLTQTRFAQPAILTHSIAALTVLREQGKVEPVGAAGHSLGEWSALVAAGVLRFGDAVRLVHRRGVFMEDTLAPGVGGMVAVLGLEREAVTALCDEAARGQVLEIATHNGPGHFVVAGHREALDRLRPLALEKGASAATELQVSTPFHCSLMAEAGARLEALLGEVTFGAPRFPVRSTIADAWLRADVPTDWCGLLARQVTGPVLWAEAVSALGELGVRRAVALGPGKSLLGMVKRIDRGLQTRVQAEAADFA
ncbi:MAG TPA: ACP S-malonyltransferase [Myxococcota bacterium]|nr:ACP S-malonyltransferase [Myxococcota bacterium]